ncbi:MAG: zinc-ribbon domain-containing protein [Promethearchaeota archaeon]
MPIEKRSKWRDLNKSSSKFVATFLCSQITLEDNKDTLSWREKTMPIEKRKQTEKALKKRNRGRRPLTNKNRLSILYPEITAEWHPIKNGTLRPEDVSYGSHKKVWWRCSKEDCRHEWNATIYSRTGGNGCPACAGYHVTDLNRLSICFPELATEWHSTKNGTLRPENVSYGMARKVWWVCSKENCGHEWETRIADRARGKGCPACAGCHLTDRNRLSTSFPELATEWHPTKNGTLRPEDVSYASHKKVWWRCSKEDCGYEWDTRIVNRTRSKGCPACTGRHLTDRNRLSICFPELATEWHPTKNGMLRPEDVSYGSHKKVWWRCSEEDCGYEWDTRITSRTSGRGCPACAGRQVTDRNRLSICFPELAAEWHPTKNGKLRPEDVSYGSYKKVWWVCSEENCGYEWDATISNRTTSVQTTERRGCPNCMDNYHILPGYWRPWQDFCEVLAELIYTDLQVLRQYTGFKGIQPDIVVLDDNGNPVLIIDAKMSGSRPSLIKDTENYSPHCQRLEFWCFKDPPENLDFKSVTDIPVDCFLPHQLLARIKDDQMRTSMTKTFHRLQIENQRFNEEFSKLPT